MRVRRLRGNCRDSFPGISLREGGRGVRLGHRAELPGFISRQSIEDHTDKHAVLGE